MATVMASVVDGVIVQDDSAPQVASVPFDPWCCADPWRRVAVGGRILSNPEIVGFFSSPNMVLRWEGPTDLMAAFSFVWSGSSVVCFGVGGAWIDTDDGSSDWGVPFATVTVPEVNSPRANLDTPFSMRLDWRGDGDPLPVASFFVDGALSASVVHQGLLDMFSAYGYPEVPDPTAVGVAIPSWGAPLTGPTYNVDSLTVGCIPAPPSLPQVGAGWESLA